MMDLAVINGLVFIEGGFRKADVGIKDGKFALIAEPGCLPEAERTIDAGGKYVLPGGIDTHVHYRDPAKEPNLHTGYYLGYDCEGRRIVHFHLESRYELQASGCDQYLEGQ